jgi:RecB family exonuclease
MPERALCDRITRIVMLKRACADIKQSVWLGISGDFLAFLDHADFFLDFFDELSLEGVEPEELLRGDTYAEYDDHIAILKELRDRYYALLTERNLADRSMLARDYALNLGWLGEFDRVEIVIEGALSSFERKLLESVSQTVPTTLKIALSPFDHKLSAAFGDLPLASEVDYDLTRRAITARKTIAFTPEFRLLSADTRAKQALIVISEVFALIDRGVDPSEIAVVLPDESFAAYLRRFDRWRAFNYAFGFSFETSAFYRSLLVLSRREESPALALAFKRECAQKGLLAAVAERLEESGGGILETLLQLADENEKPLAAEALAELKPIIDEGVSAKEALRLYLSVLREKSFDDVGGGKVTVLGVLETRAVSFEAVIVPDFNEEFLPKKSSKDLFLDTAVREKVSLPTRFDRADLQRSFLWRLFARSEYRTIICVVNDDSRPSSFIAELGIENEPIAMEIDATPFFTPPKRTFPQPPIDSSADLTKIPLSARGLASFLLCERQFYYRYVARLKEDDRFLPKTVAAEIGTKLHLALAAVATEEPRIFGSGTVLKNRIIAHISQYTASAREAFEIRLWERRLEEFCANEERRFNEGWRITVIEERRTKAVNGVELTGRIDRVDRRGEETIVLDYKSGSQKPSWNELQLEIYRALLFEYENVSAAYYYLRNGRLEPIEGDRYKELCGYIERYKAPRHEFAQCERLTPCGGCEFQILCGRK